MSNNLLLLKSYRDTEAKREKKKKNATIKCSLGSLIPQINENTTVHVGVVATFVAISSMHEYYSQINSFSHTHTLSKTDSPTNRWA